MKNNKELIKKYKLALIKSYSGKAENGDDLGCHTLDIKKTIKTLQQKDYEPTALDIVWVDYFLD